VFEGVEGWSDLWWWGERIKGGMWGWPVLLVPAVVRVCARMRTCACVCAQKYARLCIFGVCACV